MKTSIGIRLVVLVLASGIVFGCASAPVVAPTDQEREAVKEYKKTVAIVEISDKNSQISGISDLAQSRLDNLLAGHFNLVERQQIEAIQAEREFAQSDDVERFQELGKFLGADYLVFATTSASMSRSAPSISSYRDKKDRFHGSISRTLAADLEISLRFVSVSDGIAVYSGKQKAHESRQEYYRTYDDEEQFRRAAALETVGNIVERIVLPYGGLQAPYSELLATTLDNAVNQFRNSIRTQFPQGGEILQILSPTEVMINLGSAYGIEPGSQLIIWDRQAEIVDPKTGLSTTPKRKKAVLQVTQVTSGLTAIAKGRAKDVAALREGDPVDTYR